MRPSRSPLRTLLVALPAFLPGDPAPAAGGAAQGSTTQFDVAANVEPGLLERLCAELPPGSGASWGELPGAPRVPELPAVLVSLGDRLALLTGARVEVLDLGTRRWREDPIALPEVAGEGATAIADGGDALVLVTGGDRTTVLRVELDARRVTRLPDATLPVGRGAALVRVEDEIVLAPGREGEQLLSLPDGAGAWCDRGRVGGESPMHTSFGRSSGFLAHLGSFVYAWPDHHIHRMDVERNEWKPGNWLAMKFLPSSDGGGVEPDPSTGTIFAVCGAYSRSIGLIVPANNPESYFLRPRLPVPLIGEGDRLAIALLDGVPTLFVYAVQPENRLYHLPTRAFEPITQKSDAADTGSAWHRADFYGGGNGVRRWETRRWRAIPGPNDDVPRTQGTLVVMGPMGDELFFLRRAFLRRARPDTLETTHYPGLNLGRNVALGAAGVFDGEHSLYVITGRAPYFVRWQVPTGPPVRVRPDPQPPLDRAEVEVLAPMPGDVGRGAALAFQDGTVYALRGGEHRDLWAYRVAEERWEALPPLPEEATPPGGGEAGLVPFAGGLIALTSREVWRLDLAAGTWSRHAELPFAPDWDGGMTAADGAGHLYVFKGGVSTRFGCLDLATRRFDELLPRPPDVVSGEGNRLAVVEVDGEPRLYLHRGHNTNEVLWIRLADLRPADG